MKKSKNIENRRKTRLKIHYKPNTLIYLHTYESTASEGTALSHALHHTGCHAHLQLPGGKVVEEEERLRTMDEDIVHAHGNQVLPHRVMHAGCLRHLNGMGFGLLNYLNNEMTYIKMNATFPMN